MAGINETTDSIVRCRSLIKKLLLIEETYFDSVLSIAEELGLLHLDMIKITQDKAGGYSLNRDQQICSG